jgi:antitoxin MazE
MKKKQKNHKIDSTVTAWGNSLGVRIPKTFAEIIGIHDGAQIAMELKDGSLIISPANTDISFLEERIKDLDLAEMVSRINKNNRHELIDDEPCGREVW